MTTGYDPYDEYIDQSRGRPAWNYPECPECESRVFVAGFQGDMYDFTCHICGINFNYDPETMDESTT